MKKIIGTIALAVAAVALVGYASLGADTRAPVHITLTSKEMSYSPASLHLRVGVPVHIELRNEGKLLHDLNIQGISVESPVASGHAAHQHHDTGDDRLHIAAQPGKSAAVMFTPKAGEYIFNCAIPGHCEAGMTGKLFVH
jgi:uncharacterized cupredoxin-like copper-binding protein